MENASKALLIAGAILVVIIIIGLGMNLLGSSKGSFDEAVSQMSSQELEMFNTQFTQYAGTRVNGSNVKALMQKINSNNVINQDTVKEVEVTATGIFEGDSPNYQFTGDEASTARYYKVTAEDSDNDGLVDQITIEKAGTK